ncbi:armadillo-type protein [Gorgonomyces haynaldii]|nr:armadillo-type protein [Gorgonomyces haynaldii]
MLQSRGAPEISQKSTLDRLVKSLDQSQVDNELQQLLKWSGDEAFATQFLQTYGIHIVLQQIKKNKKATLLVLHSLSRVNDKSLVSVLDLEEDFMDCLDIWMSTVVQILLNHSMDRSKWIQAWLKLLDSQWKKQILTSVLKLLQTREHCLLLSGVLEHYESEYLGIYSGIVARMIDILQDSSPDFFSPLVQSLLSKDRTKAQGLHLLSLVFMANPGVGQFIVEKNNILFEVMETVEFDSKDIKMATLEMLSNACSDTNTRKKIAVDCADFLMQSSRDPSSSAVANLCLIKIMSLNKIVENHILQRKDLAQFFTQMLEQNQQIGLEALSYLSALPKVKQTIHKDKQLFRLLLSFSKTDRPSQYALSVILMHLTSYPPELTEEQKQVKKLNAMAKSEQQQDEETHKQVTERIDDLVTLAMIPVIVFLGKIQSKSIQECICSALLCIATNQKHRGLLVQMGAPKLLLQYTSKLSEQHALLAAQALAKIAITTDPSIAFFGEMALELVRPLMHLLDSEKLLWQFEALMALTNLAGMNDSLRHRILQLEGLTKFENAQFSSHHMVQRAATECLCNMIFSEQVFFKYVSEDEHSRIKIMVALMDSDDFETRRASAGCVAILSSTKQGAMAVAKQKRFNDIVGDLLADENPEILHRAVEIVKNMAQFKMDCRIYLAHLVTLAAHPAPPVSEGAREAISYIE